jgi:hypothetical protein
MFYAVHRPKKKAGTRSGRLLRAEVGLSSLHLLGAVLETAPRRGVEMRFLQCHVLLGFRLGSLHLLDAVFRTEGGDAVFTMPYVLFGFRYISRPERYLVRTDGILMNVHVGECSAFLLRGCLDNRFLYFGMRTLVDR